MRKNFLVMVCCFLVASSNLFAKEYYIEGYVERSVRNKTSYFTLQNATGYGIKFQNYRSDAKKYSDGSLGFAFYNVETDCPKGLTSLRLEKWNIEENGWQREVESKKMTPQKSDTRRTSIVLVLDVTASLGTTGLERVQRSAIEFLQEMLRQTGGNGTAHVGIVAFAGRVDTAYIRPLTHSSFTSLQNFILNQDKGIHNTYLYSAVDKAVSMLENYTPDSQYQAQEFQGASIVTFTDGKDNGSESEDAMYFGDDYLRYVASERLKQKIEGKSIESYVMLLRGADVSSSDIDKLKTLATTTTQHFKSVANFDELQRVFIEIAKSLKVTWYDLICYTPQVTGRVRWVLDYEEPKPAPKPVEPVPTPKPTPAPTPRWSPSYTHELGGIVVGNNGLTYKFWNMDNGFAYQLDLAYNIFFNSMDVQSNFMYQNYIESWGEGDLLWYIGGGTSFGGTFGSPIGGVYNSAYSYDSDYDYDYNNNIYNYNYGYGYDYGYNYDYGYSGYEYGNDDSYSSSSDFIWGLNAILGMEWKFSDIPLSLSLDYRPGIGVTGVGDPFLLMKYADFSLGVRWYIEK